MTVEEQLDRIVELVYQQIELAKEVSWRYLDVKVQEAHKRMDQYFDWIAKSKKQ